MNEEYFLYFGGRIGYWQGDVTKLLEDVADVQPAMFVGVPRVFDRIYARVMGTVRAGARTWVVSKAGLREQESGAGCGCSQPGPLCPMHCPQLATGCRLQARSVSLIEHAVCRSPRSFSCRCQRAIVLTIVYAACLPPQCRRLQVQSGSFIKRSLFNWGMSRKLYFLKQGRPQAQVRTGFLKYSWNSGQGG